MLDCNRRYPLTAVSFRDIIAAWIVCSVLTFAAFLAASGPSDRDDEPAMYAGADIRSTATTTMRDAGNESALDQDVDATEGNGKAPAR